MNAEIVFPTLVPNEQVIVNYLYLPPLIWSGVNSFIRSDEELGRFLDVMPVIRYPRWVYRIMAFLLFLGFVTAIYVLIELGLRFWPFKI